MKKILFLINSMPATFSANVLCDERVIAALQGQETFQIHCLCYKQLKDEKKFEIVDGVYVHRIVDKEIMWRIWALRKPTVKMAQIVFKIQRMLMRLKQIICIPIYPIYEPIRCRRFEYYAEKLYLKEKFDLVVSEHNGLDTLYAGFRLKKKHPEVKFVPIFWDSLAGGFSAKYLPKSFCVLKKTNIEQKVLGICDSAIMMESHKGETKKRWSNFPFFSKICFLNIPYLVEPIKKKKGICLTGKKKNIVFAGSFSSRNPQYIISLFKFLNRDDVSIWFFTAEYYHQELFNIIGAQNNHFTVHTYVPNDVLVSTLMEADCFLNIGVLNPNAISGKIFEYMSFGKPIISTYSIDNEACLPYLEKYPLSLLIDERKNFEENATRLNDFLDTIHNVKVPYSDVAALFPHCTPKAYVDFLEQTLEE